MGVPRLAPMTGPATHQGAAVLVPVKAFGAAKARLAGHLTPDQRAHLARGMAELVLAAAAPLPVAVACDDEAVRDWATGLGAEVVWCPDRGLNGAVADGVASLAVQGFDRVVVAHADLPHATSLEWLARLPDPTEPRLVTVVPDRHDDGTNVICVPARSGFAFAYGPSSFRRHVAEAQRLGLAVRVERDEALGWDVDLPSDLDAGLAHRLGITLPLLEEPCP